MLFYFKYNWCFSWCTWKELGYAVNSDVVCGRLPTFATESKRGTMQKIRERGKILSLLQKKRHLEIWFSPIMRQKDPFWHQTMFSDQVTWALLVAHCIFLVFHRSDTGGYSAVAVGCWRWICSSEECSWRWVKTPGLILCSEGFSAS